MSKQGKGREMDSEQLWPVEVEARDGYTLWVRFNDGVEGEVDLAPRAGRGVFKIWDEPGAFESVSITPYRAIRWTGDAELCADAVYLELTGKEPEEIMPGLRTDVDDAEDRRELDRARADDDYLRWDKVKAALGLK